MEHKRGCAQPALEQVLACRNWNVREKPFRHVVVQNVFNEDYYQQLENSFRSLLAKGLSDEYDDNRFSRNMGNYDAFGCAFDELECGPFEIFFNRQFHDFLAGVFGVDATGDIESSRHHHGPRGRSGSIHNDFNPCWFPKGRAGEINVASDVHNEKKGREHHVVRAVSLIYYLNNDWSPGDGGETGFYSYHDVDVLQPDVAVPPRNNSLLAFECTPFSYHSFIANGDKPRDSFIMWLHREYNDAIKRYGEENLVAWN
jgi:2OG-Fe(II) oxygenase superfamily